MILNHMFSIMRMHFGFIKKNIHLIKVHEKVLKRFVQNYRPLCLTSILFLEVYGYLE